MKRWLMFFAVMLLAVPLTMGMPAMTPAAAADSGVCLYGHDNARSMIVKIDTDNGSAIDVGTTGFDPITPSGMATCRGIVEGENGILHKPGTMFALLTDTEGDWVVVIDPTTGAATKVVKSTRTEAIVGRGISFGPDCSTLYLIEGNGNLSTIDTTDGTVNLVGNTGYGGISLQLDPKSGTFYYITVGGEWLVNIEVDGSFISKVGLDPTLPACTLVVSPPLLGGIWYTVSGERLYTIDIETGAATVVPGSHDLGQICGTAFAPERPRDTAPEQCKVTGGAEGEFEYLKDGEPDGDHRISFGFNAISTDSPRLRERPYGYVVVWPAKGQFTLVDHTSGEKIKGHFTRILSECPFGPNRRIAEGRCTLNEEDYNLAVEVVERGEPGVYDHVRIELFYLNNGIAHVWVGELEGGNLQVKCKGPEVELEK